LFVAGEGLETILQVVPLKCSMSVVVSKFAVELLPSANRFVAEADAIAVRVLLLCKTGLATKVQRMPSKCIMSVETVKGEEETIPTAHTFVAETTVTAFN
jgi:hypothetical protein